MDTVADQEDSLEEEASKVEEEVGFLVDLAVEAEVDTKVEEEVDFPADLAEVAEVVTRVEEEVDPSVDSVEVVEDTAAEVDLEVDTKAKHF